MTNNFCSIIDINQLIFISIDFGKKVFESAPEPKKAIFVSHAGHNNLYEFKIYDKIKHFLKELNK